MGIIGEIIQAKANPYLELCGGSLPKEVRTQCDGLVKLVKLSPGDSGSAPISLL